MSNFIKSVIRIYVYGLTCYTVGKAAVIIINSGINLTGDVIKNH